MKNTIIEVGANTGEDTARFVRDGNNIVYAIEPDPFLIKILQDKFKGIEKLILLPYAIDLEETTKTFYISELNRGINSLFPLHPELLNTALAKHPTYQVGFSSAVQVQTRRLDSLMEEYGIETVEYLWIDAQGNDLKALQSLGDRIQDVDQGRCECTYKVPIYTGTDNTYESVKTFLDANGFITTIDYVHQDESEVDIRFWRK